MGEQLNTRTLNIAATVAAKQTSYRFEIFKGDLSDKKIEKKKLVGAAVLLEKQSTYTIYLNTFINEVYYLLPGASRYTTADYVIMSRQKATKPGKKFIWRPVGEGRLVEADTGPLLHLVWDLFDSSQIYMNMSPVTQSVENEMVSALREVLKA